jgi:hypothetical protein
LKEKGKLLANFIFNKFELEGLEILKEMTLEFEVIREKNRLKLLKFIKSNFEQNLIEVAKDFNDDFNRELLTLTHNFLGNNTYVLVHDNMVDIMNQL